MAKYLDISKDRLKELREHAQVYIIDRAFDRLGSKGQNGQLTDQDQLKIIEVCPRGSPWPRRNLSKRKSGTIARIAH